VSAPVSQELARAVSPYTGIIRSVEECLSGTADPPFFQVVCEMGLGDDLLGAGLGHLSGIGGSGPTREAAISAAVGEALERYAASYVPFERLIRASARELGDAAIPPERFALFSDRQHRGARFPFRKFDEDARVLWVEGSELVSGRSVLAPAELVFLAPARLDGAEPIGHSTSSGLACAADPAAAVLRALCELLERDAFMIVWANRLTLPLLEAGRSRSIERESARFARAGLGFAAVDLSIFHGLPTVLAVVRAPAGFPGALGVGAAVAPSIEEAWWKALAEAFAARTAAAKLALLEPEADAPRPIRSFEDHIRHYSDHANADTTRFLDESEARVPAERVGALEGTTTAERISGLVRRVEAAGASAYVVDVTSPDVAELGLCVHRVLTPGLCSLDVLHEARFLGGRRLYEAAVPAGLRAGMLSEEDVNPDPHPFP
jgi:ribosomal protein S12 methylthiotransferase accessory factor